VSFLQRLEMMQWSLGGYHGGGGGGGGNGSDNPPAPTPAPTPAQAPTPEPDFGSDWPTWDDVVDDPVWQTTPANYDGGSDSENNTPVFNPPPTPVPAPSFPPEPVSDPIQDALDDLGLPDYGDDQQALDDITDTITDMNNSGPDIEPTYTTTDLRNILQSSYGDRFTNIQGQSSLLDSLGDSDDYAGVTERLNTLTGEDSNRNFTYLPEVGQYAVVDPSDEAATYFNKLGQTLATKIGGFLTGGVLGDLAFSLGGSDLGAVQGALVTDAATQGIVGYKSGGFFDKNKILRTEDGTLYINDGYTNPFTGKENYELKTVEQKTQETISANEAAQKNQSQSDYDYSAVAEAVQGGTGGSVDWKDFRQGISLTPSEIINAGIAGVDMPPELYDAARLTARISGGQDPVTAAVNVYGDNVFNLLPEGYKQPTEAAVRIGLGENRVAVLGDIYGEDFNLDNPLGKAGLKGAEVYDMTGDGDKALQDSVYTYFKEGGKLPDFEVPNFLPDNVNLDIDLDWLRGAGFKLKEGVDFLGSIDFPSLNMDLNGIKAEGIDIGKIDFSGVKPIDLGVSLPKAKDMGVDIESLDLSGIDLPSIQAGLDYYSQSGVIPESEQFQSLESDFELTQDDESLARKLISTAV
jgi:hypothetical protein